MALQHRLINWLLVISLGLGPALASALPCQMSTGDNENEDTSIVLNSSSPANAAQPEQLALGDSQPKQSITQVSDTADRNSKLPKCHRSSKNKPAQQIVINEAALTETQQITIVQVSISNNDSSTSCPRCLTDSHLVGASLFDCFANDGLINSDTSLVDLNHSDSASIDEQNIDNYLLVTQSSAHTVANAQYLFEQPTLSSSRTYLITLRLRI